MEGSGSGKEVKGEDGEAEGEARHAGWVGR